jgi:dolichol-phosphate mannosyltransferase
MNDVLKSPEISIVVPTYNEEGNIYKLYEQIVENLIVSSIKDYEIIYVDDGSSDASLKHIKELCKVMGINFTIK